MSKITEIYNQRKAQGLCVRCGGSKATEGVYCAVCKSYFQGKYQARKEPEGEREPKYNCHFYNALKRECGALNCLNCTMCKCSFYETEAEYKERQKRFNNEIGYQLQLLNDLAEVKGWDKDAFRARQQRLLNLDIDQRKAYLNNLATKE